MRLALAFIAVLLLQVSLPTVAGEAASAEQLRQDFNRRYQDYLRPDSQALLPFAKLEKAACQQLIASGHLRLVYAEPGKAYNAKVYTFTLYQESADGYYLDAKGGFWGMDELCYGPLAEKELR